MGGGGSPNIRKEARDYSEFQSDHSAPASSPSSSSPSSSAPPPSVPPHVPELSQAEFWRRAAEALQGGHMPRSPAPASMPHLQQPHVHSPAVGRGGCGQGAGGVDAFELEVPGDEELVGRLLRVDTATLQAWCVERGLPKSGAKR